MEIHSCGWRLGEQHSKEGAYLAHANPINAYGLSTASRGPTAKTEIKCGRIMGTLTKPGAPHPLRNRGANLCRDSPLKAFSSCTCYFVAGEKQQKQ